MLKIDKVWLTFFHTSRLNIPHFPYSPPPSAHPSHPATVPTLHLFRIHLFYTTTFPKPTTYSVPVIVLLSPKVVVILPRFKKNIRHIVMPTNNQPYCDFSSFLKRFFPCKVQKISLNAGFTCPNRDGSIGWGGCTYCNNQTFNPAYCHNQKSITRQLEEGKQFFAHKYPSMKYLAYFQAYTNTYANLETLVQRYEEALSVPDVEGLVIGTRPDCMPESLLSYLRELRKRTFVLVEYGIESTLDSSLKRINRGHTYSQAVEAVERTATAGIPVGAHLILGLPGESRTDMIRHAEVLNQLPLDTLKIHQLQLIRGTRMAHEYELQPNEFHLFDVDEYIALVIDFMERLRPELTVERFVSESPKPLLIAPDWGMKNYEVTNRLRQTMIRQQRYQGRCYQS